MSSGPWTRPQTMTAVVIRGTEARVERDRPLPQLRSGYILVKTEAIALNPTDWKHVALGLGTDGCLVGCDFSGVVKEIGPAVTKQWNVGDRICGVAHGGNKLQIEDGAFAEYIVVKGDIQLRMPESMAFAQAATIGLGATTVGQGLYQQGLKIPLPKMPPQYSHGGPKILIYGGSTATGALGIQYARRSGYSVLTTCSPKNFTYVKEQLGATEAFDYNDETSLPKLRKHVEHSGLKLAWDTIGTPASAKFCMQSLDVGLGCTLMYSVFGEPFEKKGKTFLANPEDFAFTKDFMLLTERLLADGQLRPHLELVGKNGLEGVPEGLSQLRRGDVSGRKLVFMVADTPSLSLVVE